MKPYSLPQRCDSQLSPPRAPLAPSLELVYLKDAAAQPMALAYELEQDFSGQKGEEQLLIEHLQGVLNLARAGALFAVAYGIGIAFIVLFLF